MKSQDSAHKSYELKYIQWTIITLIIISPGKNLGVHNYLNE